MRSRTSLLCVVQCTMLTAAGGWSGELAATAVDPGVRAAPTDNGTPPAMPGLGADELAFFQDGLARFNVIEVVSGALPGQGNGLGPRFNSYSCGSCHSQPYVGGSSPPQNPLIAIATANGAANGSDGRHPSACGFWQRGEYRCSALQYLGSDTAAEHFGFSALTLESPESPRRLAGPVGGYFVRRARLFCRQSSAASPPGRVLRALDHGALLRVMREHGPPEALSGLR